MSCISIVGGIRRWRTRRQTGRSASARRRMSWSISSSAGHGRGKDRHLIESKKRLSDEVLAGANEINLTEMKNDDLLRLVALDLNAAMKD